MEHAIPAVMAYVAAQAQHTSQSALIAKLEDDFMLVRSSADMPAPASTSGSADALAGRGRSESELHALLIRVDDAKQPHSPCRSIRYHSLYRTVVLASAAKPCEMCDSAERSGAALVRRGCRSQQSLCD